jgi:hypothetical protein
MARRTRQQILERAAPPQLHVIIDVGVLERPVGAAHTMRNIACAECPTQVVYIEGRDQVRALTLRFGTLTEQALSQAKSVRLISQSSFSGGGGNGGAECVEAAALPDGRVAMRDSKNPGGGRLLFPHDALSSPVWRSK